MSSTYVIRNEEDAYTLLAKLDSGEITFDSPDIEFSGWPVLHFEVKGKGYESTITPPLMRSFLEYQKRLYRSYALTSYNTDNINRLTDEEKEKLQIQVKVSKGSSIFDIDLQAILMELIKEI